MEAIKFKVKKKLNFAIKDKDHDVQKLNLHTYKMALWGLFIFLMVLIPLYIYIFITLKNSNLHHYFENHDVISQYLDLPSKMAIMGNLWASVALLGVVALLFILFKPFITIKDLKKEYKMLYITGLIIVGLVSLLLAALSQYYYSKFEDFYIYEALTSEEFTVPALVAVSKFFTDTYNNNVDVFIWENSDIVWWVMFIQIIILFAISISLQNVAFGKKQTAGIDRYIKLYSNDKNISGSKFKRFLSRIFRIDNKTLSMWTIVVTLAIITPQFIYVVLTSSSTTSMGSLIEWTNKIPNLIKDSVGYSENADFIKVLDEITADPFTVTSLPVIVVGIAFASTFFFISVTIRGENISTKIFVSQYLILFIELVVLISLVTYSKIEIDNITRIWNTQQPGSEMANNQLFLKEIHTIIGEDNFKKIVDNMYPLNGIENVNNTFEWLDKTRIVAESVIYFAIIIAAFLILGNSVVKSNAFKKYIDSQEFKNPKNLFKKNGSEKNVKTRTNRRSNPKNK